MSDHTDNHNTPFDAFLAAVNDGDSDTLRTLLKDGAIDVNQQDDDGSTALMLAARNDHVAYVAPLPAVKGTEFNLEYDNSDTVLWWATCRSHGKCVAPRRE